MDRGRRTFAYFRRCCAPALLFLPVLFTSAARADLTGISTAPSYSAAGIVQAAAQVAGALAPNGIATLYGTNLSFTTHALTPSDLVRGDLPLSLDGVVVYMNGITANLFYVSPGQINFLVPYEITASVATIYVVRQNVAGPVVTVPIAYGAPAFFEWSGNLAVAEHADGSLVSAAAPAQGGEVIVLFAAGLGRTAPDLSSGQIVQQAASILYSPQLQILLNGSPCPASSILYAGVTPGFAGLYQINLRLPAVLPLNPQIQIAMGAQISPAAVLLPVQ